MLPPSSELLLPSPSLDEPSVPPQPPHRRSARSTQAPLHSNAQHEAFIAHTASEHVAFSQPALGCAAQQSPVPPPSLDEPSSGSVVVGVPVVSSIDAVVIGIVVVIVVIEPPPVVSSPVPELPSVPVELGVSSGHPAIVREPTVQAMAIKRLKST